MKINDELDFNDIFDGKEQFLPNIIKSLVLKDVNTYKAGLLNILKANTKKGVFDVDEYNKLAIAKLFAYFNGNTVECQKYDLDLNKGILLVGGVGSGKSDLMIGFKHYCKKTGHNGFRDFTAQELIDNYKLFGAEYFKQFAENITDTIQRIMVCYVDDIASRDENAKNYGNQSSVIEDFMSIRYNIFKRYRKLTHFSTNIYPIELKKIYDERIIDRLIDMCNIVELDGPSRRK